ncbi:MAG: MFS transporter, partial [Gluconacetobacter diazotrophicus]|nr:MFS transporter [Gluconacetobacter diazotrophicus]
IIVAAISAEFNDEIVGIGIGDVSGGLGLTHDPSTWLTSLYPTCEVLGMSLSPWLLQTFTLRQFALFVLVVNATSSTLIPLCTEHYEAIYILRGLQGLAGGFTIPLLMTTALRVLTPDIRLYGLAIYSLTATFTPAMGSTMAALWTDLVGWQFVFFESFALCAIAGVMVWWGVDQDPPRYERIPGFDWRGALLIIIGLGSLTTMLQQGDRLDWFNNDLICELALASVVAIPLLLVNEWFHPTPLLKLQLLARPNLAYGCVALFTFVVVSQSGSTVPNMYLQEVRGFRPEQFYTVTLLVALSQLVMLPLMAVLLDRPWADARVVNFLGLALVVASCIGMSLVEIRWFRAQFYLWTGLQAVGQPMVVMSLLMLSTNDVKGPQEAPFVSGLVNTPRAVAEAVGAWLVALIARWRGRLHSDRLVDQTGGKRWNLIQGHGVLPGYKPPLMPDGRPSSPGSLAAFQHTVTQQTQILTISDTFLLFAGLTLALMAVLVILTHYTPPPRILAQQQKH